METKQSARELLELASQEIAQAMGKLGEALGENDINEAKSVWCDMDALKTRIDAYLAAPSESAMEMVRQIRDLESYGGGDYEYYLDATDAAALIEGLQRRVPRAMLVEIIRYVAGMIEWDGEVSDYKFVDKFAAKYGVVIE